MKILNRKLAVILAFFVAGVFLYQYSPFLTLILFPLSLLSVKFAKNRTAILIFAVFMFFAGGMYTSLTESLNYKKAAIIEGTEQEISGTIISIPEVETYGQSAVCLTEYGKIRLMTSMPILSYKDEVTFHAKCYYPEEKSRSFQFDYPKYLKSEGIYLLAFAESITVDSNSLSLLNPLDAITVLRSHLIDKSDILWSDETLMFARSILLGDTSFSTAAFKEKLSEGSISHIIAVSGAHVSIVAAMFIFLSELISKRKRALSLLAVPFILAFVVLTGSSPSALRAAIMMIIYLIAKSTLSHYDGFTALFIAAFIILISNPFSLFSLSFILSFSAVSGILLFAKPLSEVLSFLRINSLINMLAITLSAQMFTVITLALSFGRIPFTALIINIFVVPFIPFIMIAGYLSLAISFILPHLSVFSIVTELLIDICISLATLAGKFPFANIYPVFINTLTAIIIYTLFILTAISFLILKKRKASAVLLILFISSLFFNSAYPFLAGEKSVYFIDSGHGDSTLVFNKDKAILIDCMSPEEGFVKDTLLPILRHHGHFNIDAVFISEYDSSEDNISELMQSFPVSAIYLPANANAKALSKVSGLYGTKICFLSEGESITVGNISVSIPFFIKDTNSYLVSNSGTDILIPGNITEAKEKLLAERIRDVHFLKAPRHGNKASCSETLLDAAKPEAVIVSTGRRLSDDFSERLKNYPIYSTKTGGDITVNCKTKEIKPYKKVK